MKKLVKSFLACGLMLCLSTTSHALYTHEDLLLREYSGNFTSFHEGVAVFQDSATGLYGAVDVAGNILFDDCPYEISRFYDGYAISETEDYPKTYTVIDLEGNVTLQDFEYEIPYPFQEGTAVARYEKWTVGEYNFITVDSAVGIINPYGEFTVPFGIYDSIICFTNGLYRVEIKDYTNGHQYGVIRGDGTVVLPLDTRGFTYVDENTIIIHSDTGSKVVDLDGNVLFEGVVLSYDSYDEVYSVCVDFDYYAIEQEVYYMDKEFNRIGTFTGTDELTSYYEYVDGYIVHISKENSVFGKGYTSAALLDIDGNLLSSYDYESIDRFSEGFFVATRDTDNNPNTSFIQTVSLIPYTRDGFGFLDTTGTPLTLQLGEIWPAWNSYNENAKNFPFSRATDFQDGVSYVKGKNDKYALLNSDGTPLTDFIYDSFGSFATGVSNTTSSNYTNTLFIDGYGLAVYQGQACLIANPHALENGTITLPEPPTPTTGASVWAVPFIQEAYDMGLLEGLDAFWGHYEEDITREQFCVLMMNVYRSTGKTAVTGVNPFEDTTNPDIVSAYHLGIVKGTSDTTFSPSNKITRQELAVMVQRTAEIFETITGLSSVTSFSDDSSIATWAKESVFYAQREGFLTGSDGKIFPLENLSNQEAVTVALRLAQRFA